MQSFVVIKYCLFSDAFEVKTEPGSVRGILGKIRGMLFTIKSKVPFTQWIPFSPRLGLIAPTLVGDLKLFILLIYIINILYQLQARFGQRQQYYYY